MCVCVCVLEGGGGGEGLKRGENIRSKHEVTPKHDLIGCQTWHDWLSIIWSLLDPGENFRAKSSTHEKAELDIEYFFRQIDPDLCQYAYAFRESGFTSSITKKYWRQQDFQSLSL